MKLVFPYEERKSNIFPKIKRPYAEVFFWSELIKAWLRYKMVVDTGADYTILPKYCSVDLGINLHTDCTEKMTSGVGGTEIVYLLKKKAEIKIGTLKLKIPLGFINSNNIPPLLGREECLNIFKLTFIKFHTEIYI